MTYRSMSSDIISKTCVDEMCQDITTQLQALSFNLYNKDTSYTMDPNLICRKNPDLWLIPYYERHPDFH